MIKTKYINISIYLMMLTFLYNVNSMFPSNIVGMKVFKYILLNIINSGLGVSKMGLY